MNPGAHNEARALRHVRVGLIADRLEISELRGQERVVPTGHQQHRGFDVAGAALAVDRLPVGISLFVNQPIVKEGYVADGTIVGLDPNKPRCSAA
jgi:hypothetical protein